MIVVLATLLVAQGQPDPPVPPGHPSALIKAQVDEQAKREAARAEAFKEIRKKITFEVSIDPAPMKLADRAVVTITARHPKSVELFFPREPELKPFRHFGDVPAPETAMQGEQLVSTWKLPIAAMRVGRRKFPPIEMQLDEATLGLGKIKTPPFLVTIRGRIDQDSDEVSLAGNSPPMKVYDKNWVLIIVLIGLGVVVLTVVLTLVAVRYIAGLPRRGPPPPPKRPAHEIAQERLAALREKQLLPLGELRAFTFEVSEILREYLGNRYGHDTLEMTTRELLECMRSTGAKGLSLFELEEFTTETDLVKFANLTPTYDECTGTLSRCEETIDKTRRSDGEIASIRAQEDYRRRLEKPAHPFKRIFAFMVDLVIIASVSTGFVLLARTWDATGLYWAGGLVCGLLLLLRDIYGAGSPGKVLTSLALTPADDIHSEGLDAAARITRNLPMILPLAGHTMELVVLVYAADSRRLGDRWAGTRVLDKRPETREHLFLLLSLGMAAAVAVIAYVIPFVWLGG